MMKKILITGGAGFIASWISDLYLEKGYRVIIVDNLSHSTGEPLNKKAKLYKADINNFEQLKEIFRKEKPQIINHHAAIATVAGSSENIFKTNVLGMINLLKICSEFSIEKFIFASSAAVYGESNKLPVKECYLKNPISEYGISKLAGENLLNFFKSKIPCIQIFRYANVYGPRQDWRGEGGAVAIFAKNLIDQKPSVIFGDGEQTRDFVYVSDIARANLMALKTNNNFILNLSSNKEITINKLFELLKNQLNNQAQLEYIKARPVDIKKSKLSNNQAETILKWKAEVSLETGLKNTISYFSDNK